MNKFAAQRKLAFIWFINAAIIGLIFVIFTASGRFGSKSSDGWQWFSQNIVPTLTLMIGTFAASMGQATSTADIEKFYFQLSYYISLFYFLILYLTIFLAPFAFNETQLSFVELLNSSKIYLNIIQGVVTFSLGLFFTKKTEPKV
jgi:uncharacterized membrane protein